MREKHAAPRPRDKKMMQSYPTRCEETNIRYVLMGDKYGVAFIYSI